MSLHAGHCSDCDTPIWRTVTHGRTGVEDITYPMPSSVYARVQVGGATTPGIGYCPVHAPRIGARGPTLPHGPSTVVGVEAASMRHAFWFTAAFGQHLRAWLQDHCELPEHELEAVMAQWREDCKAVEAVNA